MFTASCNRHLVISPFIDYPNIYLGRTALDTELLESVVFVMLGYIW